MTRRNALIGLLFVAVLAGFLGVGGFMNSRNDSRPLTLTMPAPGDASVEPNEIIIRLGGEPERVHFYLVRQASGEVLALVARDPHSGCDVEWQPDYDATQFGERGPGAFKAACTGWVFSRDGRVLFGAAARGLDRVAVNLKDHGSMAELDLSHFILGACRQEGQSACSPPDAPQFVSTLPLPSRQPRP